MCANVLVNFVLRKWYVGDVILRNWQSHPVENTDAVVLQGGSLNSLSRVTERSGSETSQQPAGDARCSNQQSNLLWMIKSRIEIHALCERSGSGCARSSLRPFRSPPRNSPLLPSDRPWVPQAAHPTRNASERTCY